MSRCPVCAHAPGTPLGEPPPLPCEAHRLRDSADAARGAAMARMRLVGCPECEHTWNAAFEAGQVRYDAGYHVALHGSPRFRAHATDLAERLVAGLPPGADVLEIGCGDGWFLRQLVQRLGGRGVGWDPSGEPQDGADLTVHAEPWEGTVPDGTRLIVLRHVLEHLPDLDRVLGPLAAAHARGVQVYIEVPDGRRPTRGLPWELLVEHVHGFSPRSLHTALTRADLPPRLQPAFGDQFLEAWVDGRRGSRPRQEGLRPLDEGGLGRWRERLHAWRDEAVVLWGCGTRGITFLNLVGGDLRVVDIDPRRQGRCVPGTGHRIEAPADVEVVDRVIVANPQYREEIAAALAQRGLAPRLHDLEGR